MTLGERAVGALASSEAYDEEETRQAVEVARDDGRAAGPGGDA